MAMHSNEAAYNLHSARIEESLPQLNAFLEGARDGLIILDGNWLCTYANQAAAAFLQTTPDELLGKTIWEALPEADRSRFRETLIHAADKKEPVEFEGHWTLLQRWYECRCYPTDGGLTLFLVDITERKRAEKALQASERRFRRLFEADNVGLYVTRPDGTFLDCNDAMVKLLGYDSREELLQRRSTELYVDPAFRQEAVRTLLEKGIYPAREGLLWRKDRSIAHALGWAVLLTDETTGEPYIQGLAVDITERRRAEEAMRKSETLLKETQTLAKLGGWEFDVATDTITWTDEVYGLYGVPKDYNPNDVARDISFYADEAQPVIRKAFERAVHEGVPYDLELELIRADGAHLWVRTLGRPVVQEGKVVRVVGNIMDITTRKELEAELRQWNDRLSEQVRSRTAQLTSTVNHLRDEISRRAQAEGELQKSSQMLEGFFEHTITPLAFMDRDFNFIRVNEAYARADDKMPEHFIGKNHFELYPNEENQAIFSQVVQTKRPYRAHAKPFAYPDDPQRMTYWNWQLTPLLDDAGEVHLLVLNLEDVTEQQNAYQELEQRTRQLQHLAMELSEAEDRERKRLAEVLHDDLQQLLAAAKFQLGLLSSRCRNEETLQELAGEIKQVLIEAIGKSRSLSHELSPPVLRQSDLCEVFGWLAEQVKAKHGLTVYLDILCPLHVDSEPLKIFLYKAVHEMLFNVIKHANVKEAQLRLHRAHGRLWLCVSDKGRGFDPQEIERTSGYGLLSVRERIELLGGRMRIKSVPGRGSVFVISVPDPGAGEPRVESLEAFAEGALPAPVVRKKRAKRTGDKRVRVLLADDHRVMREGLAAMLDEEHDMEVVGQAGNGREAVDLAYRLAPDVVVMDVAMPVMTGDEATRRIKSHLPNTRVIALSMFEDSHVSRRMHKAGAETYLSKTGPSEELLAAIRANL